MFTREKTYSAATIHGVLIICNAEQKPIEYDNNMAIQHGRTDAAALLGGNIYTLTKQQDSREGFMGG